MPCALSDKAPKILYFRGFYFFAISVIKQNGGKIVVEISP